MILKNRIGIRYGRLVVMEFAGRDWVSYILRPFWKCKCDCGNEVIISGDALQSQNTKSCGCLFQEMLSKNICKNNPNYINGEYCGLNKKLKEEIRRRDKYICQECGKTQEQSLIETNRKLDVHHRDGDDTNNAEENMTTLCCSCHRKLHWELKRLKKN